MEKLKTENGIICSLPEDTFGYFGWPTVAKTESGTLVVVSSGMRMYHICPYGRTVFLKSKDEGKTWTGPRIINDTPFDDRDTGIIALGKKKLLITWFTSDTRKVVEKKRNKREWQEWINAVKPGCRWMNDDNKKKFLGSWIRVSKDEGDTWDTPVKVPVSTPHGPIKLRSGKIIYLGKEPETQYIKAMISSDDGITWKEIGSVPLFPGTIPDNYVEPHLVELPSGKLLAHIRFQSRGGFDVTKVGLVSFSIMQTESKDGGRSWSIPEPLGFHGSPPHLLLHSSGVLICSYGYRKSPYGQRVCISDDEGKSWRHFIIRDDGPDEDLGYPSSVELSDGSILTVYYQKITSKEEKCSLLWSRWKLP